MVKKLSAGDYVSIEKKFGDPRSEKLFATIIFSANYPITTSDKSNSWTNRMIRIPFTVPHKVIPGYEKRFQTPEEFSGILNKALAGIQRVLKDGQFIKTDRTEMAKEEFKVSNDPIQRWLNNNCTLDFKVEGKLARFDPEIFWKRYETEVEKVGKSAF